MSLTDQKPRITTAEDLTFRWGGRKPGEGLRCYLCGHRFAVGDVWRWVYAAAIQWMNFITCAACDGPDVLDRWKKHCERAEQEYWWLRR